MKKLKLILIAITVSIALSNTAKAQWYGEFPFSADPNCIAISGNNIFVGTSAGAFRSTDNGTIWRSINNDMPAYTSILSLAIDGTNIFAGTNNGVFFSADSGNTWIGANKGITGYAVESFAVSGNKIFAGSDSGVFLSTDSGKLWVRVSNGLPVTTVNTLLINGNNIFAGAIDNNGFGGIFRSSDNGKTWKAVDSGLTYINPGSGLTDTAAIYSLGIVGNTIFAAAGTNGMYSSVDTGKSWVHFNISIWSIDRLAVSGAYIYAGMGVGGGIYQSADTGKSWVYVASYMQGNQLTTESIAANGKNVFAGTGGGLMVSYDNAKTWSVDDTDNGLRAPKINALAACGSKVFAAGYNKVSYSTNKGKSWFTDTINGLNSFPNSMISSGSNIFVGTSLGGGALGLLLSKDSGKTWAAANNGLPTGTPTTTAIISCFAFNGSNILMGTSNGGFSGDYGIFLSTDTGNTWTAVNNGMTVSQYSFINGLAVSGSIVFAATDSGVFRSANNGQNWAAAGLQGQVVNSIAVFANKIFAGVDNQLNGGGLIFISKDTGRTWAAANYGFGGIVSSFVIDGGNILAGTRGIFLSRDSGSTWTDVSEGLTDYHVSSLAINGNYIYAGGDGDWGGVNFRPLSDFNCNPVKPTITANGPIKFCQGGSVTLTSSAANTYFWNTGDTSKSITVSASGKDSVKITDKSGCPATSQSIAIKVNPLPPTPTITQLGDTLISSAKTGNQWMLNDTIIKGATSQKYGAMGSGKYGVIVTDGNGCTASFDSMFTILNTGIDKSAAGNLQINIYPNPFTNTLNIDATLNTNSPVNITIYDVTGRVITNENNISRPAGQFTYSFDADKYGGNSSMFIVKISAGNEVVTRQIIRIR